MNYNLITLGLAIAFISTSATASPNYKPAEKSKVPTAKTTKETNNLDRFADSFKPPNRSQPKYTIGAATRGDSCAIDQENKSEITALVPDKNQSLTLQSHPSLFAYVSPMNEDKTATLIVKDKTEDYYHSQQLTIPTSGGIVKMTLAEDAPQLEFNKNYTWFLRIQCNVHPQPEDPLVSANIMRVEGNTPDLLHQSDLVLFYANSQIWYDSLKTAFELYQSGEKVYWSQLLNSTGMNRFIY